jgi:hypothetical protein
MRRYNGTELLNQQVRETQQIQDLTDGRGWSSDKTLARYFNTSRKTIWHWAKEGKLPRPHKIGVNTTRWSNSEVKNSALLSEGEVNHEPTL